MKFVTALDCKHAQRKVKLTWKLSKPTPESMTLLRVKESEDCDFAGSGSCPVIGPRGQRNFCNCPYIPSGASG
jgi:hypothetical protein